MNCSTGLGTSRDKMSMGTFGWRPRLSDFELEAMYENADIPAKIVDDLPNEAFRTGYELEGDGEESGLADLQKDACTRLDVDSVLQDGWIWSRVYGGGLVILGVRDGRLPTEPVNEAGILSVDYLNFVDRRWAIASSYYEDAMSPKFGQPMLYRVFAPGRDYVEIHESRCLRFDGQRADVRRRREVGGWGLSVLQRPYDTLVKFESGFDSVMALLADMSQAVFKINGLQSTIAGGNLQDLQTRMALVEQTRSSMRAVMLDAENEDFTRIATPLTGVSDLLDRLMMRVASAGDMSVSRLFGRSAAGMNATGEGDARADATRVDAKREKELKPLLLRMYRLLALSKSGPMRGTVPDDLDLEFGALWTPTEKECAEAYQIRSTGDSTYVTAGVLLPAEVALARFADGAEGVSIDVTAREAEVKAEVKFEPPTPPGAVPPGPADQTPAPGSGYQ